MLVVVDTNVWISALLTVGGSTLLADAEAREKSHIRAAHRSKRSTVLGSMPRGPRLKVALRAVGVPRRHARYPRNGDSGTADRLLRCAARFRVETAVAAQAHAIVTRDDDLKGDPLVAAYAQQHGIQLLTVQRLVDMLA